MSLTDNKAPISQWNAKAQKFQPAIDTVQQLEHVLNYLSEEDDDKRYAYMAANTIQDAAAATDRGEAELCKPPVFAEHAVGLMNEGMCELLVQCAI